MNRFLPINSLSSKVVEKRSALSLERFLEDYYRSGSPVIISDCMSHWPAMTKWNDVDYFKKVAGDRIIPVEVISLIKWLSCLREKNFSKKYALQ